MYLTEEAWLPTCPFQDRAPGSLLRFRRVSDAPGGWISACCPTPGCAPDFFAAMPPRRFLFSYPLSENLSLRGSHGTS